VLNRIAVCGGLLAVLLPATTVVVPAAQADDLAVIKQLVHDLDAARQITKGRGVTVAIVSTGVDGSVASLRGKVKPGKDFVNNSHPSKLTGTMLASLIAGAGLTHYSPVGMQGLASGADILSVRVAPDEREPGYDEFYKTPNYGEIEAKGIRYAADQGAQVICIDPAVWGDDAAVRAAVVYALSKNATVVAGAFRGGDDETTPIYPAAEPGVIGVGALDIKGHRIAKASGRNSSVIVGAPGFEFPSIGPGDKLWLFQGTLPAMAWVASTAAMVRAEHPKLTQAQVAQVIISSAHHPASGYDTGVGFGMVNPKGALTAAEAMEKNPPVLTAEQGVVADKARFGGRPPAKIQAVRRSTAVLAGFGGLAGAGLLAVVLVVFLAIRRRRRTRGPAAITPFDSPGDISDADGALQIRAATREPGEPEVVEMTMVPESGDADGSR
jgi:Subtilisin-like serine proteases